jgi:hypothetical protein
VSVLLFVSLLPCFFFPLPVVPSKNTRTRTHAHTHFF